MKTKKTFRQLLMAAAIAAGFGPAALGQYTIKDIVPASIGLGISMNTILGCDEVVGGAADLVNGEDYYQPFAWTPYHLNWLATGNGTLDSIAVNNTGQIALTLPTTQGAQAYSITGLTYTPLGTPGSGIQTEGINNNGEIVGLSGGNSAYYHAFSWTSSGGMVILPTMNGFNYSEASAVNDSGQVVGSEGTYVPGPQPYGPQHAFSYTLGAGMVDLETLPGTVNSVANAVNASGEVVGTSYNPAVNGGPSLAFSWTSAGGMVNLGTLPGGLQDTGATGINDNGVIVGTSGGDAFIYENGKMTDLNTLMPANSVWHLNDAVAIADNGDIVADGYNTVTGSQDALLLTAEFNPPSSVPDGADSAKLLLGACGLLLLACSLTPRRPAQLAPFVK
jgi:probable HAF family extracellular repeat protein